MPSGGNFKTDAATTAEQWLIKQNFDVFSATLETIKQHEMVC